MNIKRALITGITGQDGAYLSQLLLSKGYEVHGIMRRVSVNTTQRLAYLGHMAACKIHYGDMSDGLGLARLMQLIMPDEVYHLAAQSHVGVSFENPEYTAQVDALGTLRILEAIRLAGLEKITRFYQASTSELYGKVQEIPQTEKTPFYPRSPYAVAKLYAYWITVNYRESYNMFACNGILFNHESPLRGEDFVTRKITQTLTRIAQGSSECLYLGNIDAQRDWGYAPDYVQAMWLMLQQEVAEDYVIATGETHSVRDFIAEAALWCGLDLEWSGSHLNECAYEKKSGRKVVAIDPKLFRPAEVDILRGDATKAYIKLGWRPTISFKELVKIMIQADMHINNHLMKITDLLL